ncbi:hypothetical protein M3Y97_00467000 [Aphelenchoides bicaudatus]|nr:hypothetical protein M3Y97_00467000 [Aphelenchoides bicaudatus]
MGTTSSVFQMVRKDAKLRPLFFKGIEASVKTTDDTAIKFFDQAIKLERLTRNNRDIILELKTLKAFTYAKNNRYDKALTVAEEALKERPTKHTPWSNIQTCYNLEELK